jgi:hypothetical protein
MQMSLSRGALYELILRSSGDNDDNFRYLDMTKGIAQMRTTLLTLLCEFDKAGCVLVLWKVEMFLTYPLEQSYPL